MVDNENAMRNKKILRRYLLHACLYALGSFATLALAVALLIPSLTFNEGYEIVVSKIVIIAILSGTSVASSRECVHRVIDYWVIKNK